MCRSNRAWLPLEPPHKWCWHQVDRTDLNTAISHTGRNSSTMPRVNQRHSWFRTKLLLSSPFLSFQPQHHPFIQPWYFLSVQSLDRKITGYWERKKKKRKNSTPLNQITPACWVYSSHISRPFSPWTSRRGSHTVFASMKSRPTVCLLLDL